MMFDMDCAVAEDVDTIALVDCYLRAKRAVVEAGYLDEIAWQSKVSFSDLTRVDFMRESAWVILCTGMRESVVRRLFPRLTEIYGRWDPDVIAHSVDILDSGLRIFNNSNKLNAISSIASRLCSLTDSRLRDELATDPRSFIVSLPYVGPVTWRHVAKNIGLEFAKADRHLVRITRLLGRESPDTLCAEIGDWVGDSVAVVDIVLWRWSVLHSSECKERGCAGTLSCYLADLQ